MKEPPKTNFKFSSIQNPNNQVTAGVSQHEAVDSDVNLMLVRSMSVSSPHSILGRPTLADFSGSCSRRKSEQNSRFRFQE